jgi:hypothetical protein
VLVAALACALGFFLEKIDGIVLSFLTIVLGFAKASGPNLRRMCFVGFNNLLRYAPWLRIGVESIYMYSNVISLGVHRNDQSYSTRSIALLGSAAMWRT